MTITTKKKLPDLARVAAAPATFDVAALLQRAAPALLVLGAWIAVHPYWGIVHDSRLYSAQALRALYPDVFGADFFFAFGSQDDFTIFSLLFAPLVDRFGLSAATMLVVAVGQSLWLSGAAALALRLAPSGAGAFSGLVLLAAMPASYCGWHVLGYGEGFATPRLLAEGFSLWALWALTHGRLAAAAALVVAGVLVHPLVTATVLCVGFLFLILRDWRWCLPALAGAAAVAVAAYAGVAPFDRLAQTMDPEWLAVVELRNVYLFPALWKGADWGWLAAAATANLAAAAVLSGWQRRLVLAATLAGLGGLLATHIGADLWRNVFLIQIQPYRTLWLLHAFSYLSAGILFAQLWRLKADGFALITLIAFSWLINLMLHAGVGAAVGAAAFGLAVLRLRGRMQPLPTIHQVAIIALTGALVGFLVVARVVATARTMAAVPGWSDFWEVFGPITVIEVVAAAALALGLLRLMPRAARTVLAAASLALVFAAAVEWDRRGDWSRALTAEHSVAAFEPLLASDAQVYWEDDVRGAWLLLRRPSYASDTQGAGIAFARRTALTFRDRAQVVQPLTNRELVDVFRAREEAPPPLPALARDTLAATCRRAPDLDAMVLSRAVAGAYAAAWELPAPIHDIAAARKNVVRPPIRRLYLYRCSDLG